MKAAIVREAGRAPVYTEFEEPRPGPGEQLIAVAAAPLTHVTKARASGTHYSASAAFPFVAGLDGVGRRADGGRVYFFMPRAPFGSMAARTAVDASHCVPLPDDIDDVTAAAIAIPAMSSWAALKERARFVAGKSVLINGATGTSGRLAVNRPPSRRQKDSRDRTRPRRARGAIFARRRRHPRARTGRGRSRARVRPRIRMRRRCRPGLSVGAERRTLAHCRGPGRQSASLRADRLDRRRHYSLAGAHTAVFSARHHGQRHRQHSAAADLQRRRRSAARGIGCRPDDRGQNRTAGRYRQTLVNSRSAVAYGLSVFGRVRPAGRREYARLQRSLMMIL